MRLCLCVSIILAAWNRPLAAAPDPVTRAEQMDETAVKLKRVQGFLKARQLGGVLLTQVKNFSWITAGIGDNHIVITSETGAASLLILADGRKYVLASNSEMARLLAEDLQGLGYQPREYKWHEDRRLEIVRELAPGARIGTDTPLGALPLLDAEFAPLRYQLTDTEIKKYRWLGRHATEAVIAVCRRLRPGVSEREMEAMASDELMKRGIRPTVLLMGVDDRILRYRHTTPSDARLRKYAFVNVCARRWGLVISTGRFVHFGALPEELRQRVRASANLTARYLAHSKPGAKAGDLLALAKTWFDVNGFPGELEQHHQGGAIGYTEREWIATPGSREEVHDRQAFAWNPIVQGALSFDTFIVYKDRLENLNEAPGWPTIREQAGGTVIHLPDILVVAVK
jgi:Xaa-Pro dipeptidase